MTCRTKSASTVCPRMTRSRPIARITSETSDRSLSAGISPRAAACARMVATVRLAPEEHQIIECRSQFGVVCGLEGHPQHQVMGDQVVVVVGFETTWRVCSVPPR
jgi:hypothetical protein